MKSLNYRYNPSDVAARSVEGSAELPPITGLAAVYFDPANMDGTEYRIRHDLVERIPAGLLDEHVGEDREILGLRDHDENLFLGRRSSKTLRTQITSRGLEYEIQTPNTQEGRDTLELIHRRDISGSSFSMLRAKARLSYEKRSSGSVYIRTITRMDAIHDLGPVLYPAYTGTSANIGARSCGLTNLKRSAGPPAEIAELEAELRDFINSNWLQSEAELRLRQLEIARA
jgi:HK97 family phage prohead protease